MNDKVFGELRRFAGARGFFFSAVGSPLDPRRAAAARGVAGAQAECSAATTQLPLPATVPLPAKLYHRFCNGCGATQFCFAVFTLTTATYLPRHGQGEIETLF